jgi:hypothetical protein
LRPQTVLNEGYWKEIAGGLRDQGASLTHVLLDCDVKVLVERIDASDLAVARQWRLDHIERYERAREGWLLAATDLTVDLTSLDPGTAAQAITQAV